MEFLKQQKLINEPRGNSSVEQEQGESPKRFPVKNLEKIYYSDEEPSFQEGVITHYSKHLRSDDNRNSFVLLETVGGLNYIFSLRETTAFEKYNFAFKTTNYEYASTNLDEDGQRILGETIATFIEDVCLSGYSNIREISISPADASYTVKEIEDCQEEILASADNPLTKEDLYRKYNGYEIFDYYRRLFGKDFGGKHYNDVSRARARSRYFKAMFRKHLTGWEVQKTPGMFSDFSLVRSNTETKV